LKGEEFEGEEKSDKQIKEKLEHFSTLEIVHDVGSRFDSVSAIETAIND
jgi:hypothetical protein